MPKITSIEPQKKNSKRVNIFIDGEYRFPLSLENKILNKLVINQEISEIQFRKLIFLDYYENIFDNLLNFLSYRPRSSKEITQHAHNVAYKKYGRQVEDNILNKVVQKAIEKLTKINQINDTEFAKWWVEQRLKSKKSIRVIRGELLNKGIDRIIIDKVFSDDTNEMGNAIALAEKKIFSYRHLEPIKKKEKLSRYLASKGFDWDTIMAVMKQLEL